MRPIRINTNDDAKQLKQLIEGFVRQQQPDRQPFLLRQGSVPFIPAPDGLTAFRAEKADMKMLLDELVYWDRVGDLAEGTEEDERPKTKLKPNVLHQLMRRLPPEIWQYGGTVHVPYVDRALPEQEALGYKYRVVDTAGYDYRTGLYLAPAEALREGSPIRFGSAVEAWQVLRHEWLGEFILRDAESEAHLLTAILHPFLQPILSRAPLYLIEANDQSSGKTLLASCLQLLAMGRTALSMWSQIEHEREYAISADLDRGNPIIVFDNVTGVIQSDMLATALTTGSVFKRGKVGTPGKDLDAHVQWIMTSNNAVMDRDMRERTVAIRLDKNWIAIEKGFKRKVHEQEAWTRDNRAMLVEACLVILKELLVRPHPFSQLPPPPAFEKFGSWTQCMWAICSRLGLGAMASQSRQAANRTQSDDGVALFMEIANTAFFNKGATATELANLVNQCLEASPASDLMYLPFLKPVHPHPTEKRMAADPKALGLFLISIEMQPQVRLDEEGVVGARYVVRRTRSKGISRYHFSIL